MCFLGKFLKLIEGLGNNYPPASDDNRLHSFVNELCCFLNLSRMPTRDNPVARQTKLIGINKVRLLLLDISRYVNKHRARPPCLSNVEGLFNRFSQLSNIGNKIVMFGNWNGDAGDIRLLKGILTNNRCSYLASYSYHRYRIHISIGDTGNQISSSRPRRSNTHSSLMCNSSIAIGGMSRSLLMAN